MGLKNQRNRRKKQHATSYGEVERNTLRSDKGTTMHTSEALSVCSLSTVSHFDLRLPHFQVSFLFPLLHTPSNSHEPYEARQPMQMIVGVSVGTALLWETALS
jgi:hypothetical protein